MSEVNEEEKWTNVQVDSQVLSSFMSCPRKTDYVFNQHLVPIGGVSKSIEKGQLAHLGAHSYWTSRIAGKDYQESSLQAIEVIKKEAIKFTNLDAKEAIDCAETMVEFLKHINYNLHWIPLAVEQHFRFLAYQDDDLRLRIYLTGRIDLIMKSPQVHIIPIDNKSESERWFYSGLRNQFKIYALACKANILGVQRIGFQKTLDPKDKFKIEIISYDPDVLEEFRSEILPYWCKRLLICKEDNYWPMNTSSCTSGHFACQFSDKYNNGGICSVSRAIRDQKIKRFFTVGEPWNPENF